eukprot:s429_g10.t1
MEDSSTIDTSTSWFNHSTNIHRDAGRITQEIRELSRSGFPASGCDALICLERAWLQLRPSKDKLPEVPNSLEPPRPVLGLLEPDALPTSRSRRKRCQSAALLRWLRARARRRVLQKARVRLVSAAKQEQDLGTPAAKKQRDALAKWLTRPKGRILLTEGSFYKSRSIH